MQVEFLNETFDMVQSYRSGRAFRDGPGRARI